MQKLKQQLATSEEQHKHAAGLPKTPQGQLDYEQDFFSKPTFLTVSGQLNAEIYATALSDVYTFGRPMQLTTHALLLVICGSVIKRSLGSWEAVAGLRQQAKTPDIKSSNCATA